MRATLVSVEEQTAASPLPGFGFGTFNVHCRDPACDITSMLYVPPGHPPVGGSTVIWIWLHGT